ncbi:sulfatase-like hydrolase/transferase [candidate division KSB1 bacterium]|nr:sulfatase-like hydrolase/transferase [candidate division KSB1 bacterium]
MSKKVTRRQFIKDTGAATLALSALSSIPGCQTTHQKPNIIFFIADDMYPEMFNCLPEGKGKNLTPNIDRLAREGTIMMNQYVVSPVCTPSRYNCMTGNYASRARNEAFLNDTHREENQTVIKWNSFISEGDKILPHYLKDLGYKTGMVGKNHVIDVKDLHFFPDFNSDPKAPDIKEKVEENYNKVETGIKQCGFDYAGAIYHNNPNFIGLKELAVQNTDWITQAGIDFIDQNKDHPFFLYFATTIPHQPGDPERSWKADPRITARGVLAEPPEIASKRDTIPERIEEAGLAGKNKENVLWLDDALGALIDKLEEHQLMENTIIFFFNDHGQKAKGTLYQGGTHNPSIIWKKDGFNCGPVSDTRVTNIDFAPTILEFAGSKYFNDKFDGNSFKPVLDGKTTESQETIFFELGYARAVMKDNFKYYAVRYPEYAKNMTVEERTKVLDAYNDTRRFRNMMIVNYDPKKPFSHLEAIPGGGQAENETYGKKPGYFDPDQLYDLSADPDEMVNLARDEKYKNKLDEMKQELQKYLDDLPGTFNL